MLIENVPFDKEKVQIDVSKIMHHGTIISGINGEQQVSAKQHTSEKLKAKQYIAAALVCVLVAVILTVIRLIWGSVMLGIGGDQIPLGMVIFYVRNPVLLIGVIDFVSAIYHFIRWNRNGQCCMDDDDNGLFSDRKSGERSSVKVSLVLMAGIVALAMVCRSHGLAELS